MLLHERENNITKNFYTLRRNNISHSRVSTWQSALRFKNCYLDKRSFFNIYKC